jgi:hypothetical protein
MKRRFHRPSGAFLVALIALFIALGGTAGAVATVVPALAKRALIADNAKKLNGFTAAQIGAGVLQASSQVPGPASTASSLVSTVSTAFSLAGGAGQSFTASCGSAGKAVGGGFANTGSGLALSAVSAPTPDGTGWIEGLFNIDSSSTAAGQVFATCLK